MIVKCFNEEVTKGVKQKLQK